MILANSGTRVSRNPEAIPSRSGSRPFAGVRFRGFRLCAELLGDDMDGVLASVTLDDLSVHEVRLSEDHMWAICFTAGLERYTFEISVMVDIEAPPFFLL